ncbi:AAA family ATPase [Fimbriiglobus ruber]|uniref:AAA domain-containing protein n=1 Tax=Fimbriiglobus ruber TaxID=1908690 RepID=A0A225CXL8_9BACT|nr:DUF3696 domain-containing protein [Fimbriiglobus ruber]OWK34110.1 hypothetical protein FRUB_10081 [Fimbriiglobus ruber]
MDNILRCSISAVDFLKEHSIDEYLIPLSRNTDDSLDVSTLGDDLMAGWVEIKLGWRPQDSNPYVQEYTVGYDKDAIATIASLRESTNTCSLRGRNLWHPIFRWPSITSVEDMGTFGVIDYLYPSVRSASQAAYLGGASATAEELRSAAVKEEVVFAEDEGFPDDRLYRVVDLAESANPRKVTLYRLATSSHVRVHSVHAAKQESSYPSPSKISERTLEEVLRDVRTQYDESETPFVRMREQDGALPSLDRNLSLLLENVDTESGDSDLGLETLKPSSRDLVRRLLNRLPSKQNLFQQVISRLLLVPGRILADSLSQFRYIGPVRDAIQRNFEPYRYPEARRWAGGLAAWEELTRRPDDLCAAVSTWMSGEDQLNTGYGLKVDEYRELPTTHPLWLGLLSGRLLDSYDNDDIQKLAGKMPVKRRVVLFSTVNNQSYLPQDVGQGITQAVPVLVAVLSPASGIDRTQGGLVGIEQPELHLNPRQQAALGDVFIHAALSTPKNRLILETHSEHLILRIQRRIRESNADNAHNGVLVKGDDVAVYYASSDAGCTRLRRIDIDKKGEFLQPWPDDFFEIDFYERFA